MTILFTEGFDIYSSYSTTEDVSLNSRYNFIAANNGSWNSYFSFNTGHINGQYLTIASGTSDTTGFIPIPITPLATICIGGYFMFTGTTGNTELMGFQNSAAIPRWTTLYITSNYLNVRGYNFGNATALYPYFAPNTWFYVEMVATVTNATTGDTNIKVYVNDSLVIDTNANAFGTAASAQPYNWSTVKIGRSWTSSNMAINVDDFYISDGERLGPIHIDTIVPMADTAQKDGIASSGSSNYTMVNDSGSNAMASYVFFSTSGQKDEYDLVDMPVIYPDDQVLAVNPISIAKRTPMASNATVKMAVVTSSGETTTTNFSLTSSNVNYIDGGNIKLSPGGSPWTMTDVNNSKLRIGF